MKVNTEKSIFRVNIYRNKRSVHVAKCVTIIKHKAVEGRERTVTLKPVSELELTQNSTLRSEVANLIRKKILDGEIPSGERLIETEIAAQLGVSRMPVREAMRTLESEGLIKQVPRRGLIVSEYTENDIREYYTIREALEVCAIKIVVDKISPEEIAELREYCENAAEAHARDDIEEVCQWTSKFNDRIYDSCEMPRLKEQIKQTQKYLRTFRFTTFKEPFRTEQALREHSEIIRLVEAKDKEGAARATSIHLRDAMEAYLKLWKKKKGKI